jgi:hypothetical protein
MCEGVGEAVHLKIRRNPGGLDRVANRNLGRRILAWSTIGFWLVMIGLLIQRENFTSSFTEYVELAPSLSLEPGETIEAEETWMGIYFQGSKVGWLHHTCEPENGGYVVQEESLTHLKMMDIPQKISVTTTCRTDNSFALTSFDFRMRSDVVSVVVLGEVEGKTVNLKIDSAGKTQKKVLRLRRPPYLFLNLRPYLVSDGLEAGKSFRVPVVLPSTLSQADAVLTVEGEEEIRIDGETREAFRIQVSYAGVEATSWYDREGRVLKEVSPMGLTMIREAAGLARGGVMKGEEAVDITASTMVSVDKRLPDSKALRYLRVALEGIDPASFEIEGGRQRLHGVTLEIVKENVASLQKISIPVRDDALADFLEATAFLQSDDEGILRLAREIVGQEKDAAAGARRLMDWVYENLEKRPTVSLPSALEVLEDRAGDCNEHAALMAALARAAGLPARLVVGVVYTGNGFFYHAWNEVWVGGWVSLDPVMAQFPADATHVKFIDGGLEEQMRMAQVIGRLSMEILEYR